MILDANSVTCTTLLDLAADALPARPLQSVHMHPDAHRFSYQVRFGYRADKSAVATIVPVVSHDQKARPRHGERTEIVPLSDFDGRISMNNVWFAQRRAVDIHNFVLDFYGIAADPDYARAWYDLKIENLLANVELYAQAVGDNIDVVWLMEDFGTQKGMMISPRMFEQMIAPYYKRLFDLHFS